MFQNKIKLIFLLSMLLVMTVAASAQKIFSSTENPRYSPDGKRFVFSSMVEQGATASGTRAEKLFSRIAVMNTDGTGFRFVTPEVKGVADLSPSFSPDGKKIVFRRAAIQSPGWGDIFVINADGTGLRQVSSDKNDEIYPEFTEDGGAVVFVRRHLPTAMGQPKNQNELVLFNLADGKERILISKEFRVVQALPISVGKLKGGFLVACAEIDQDGKPLPEGHMLALASPDGELDPRGRINLPQSKLDIYRINAFVASSEPAFYVFARVGGAFGKRIDFKATPKEVKQLPEFSSFSEANFSPDGKRAVFAYTDIRDTAAGRKVIVREIIGDQFGQEIKIAGKE